MICTLITALHNAGQLDRKVMANVADQAASPAALPKPALARLSWLDRVRGAALVAMIIYHAYWDGLLFGLIDWTAERDVVMQTAAKLIAGAFLAISGVSLALAAHGDDAPLWTSSKFWKRFAMVAGAAMIVTLATFFALPEAPIYFGILHHIALASIIIALVAPFHPFLAAALAGIALILHESLSLEVLNHPATIWLGLGTRAPVTADWVPLLPWIASGLLGFAIAKQILIPWITSRPPSTRQHRTDPLLWMGQRSLAVYLIHQPILIGLIFGYQYLIG